ncbi:MAG: type II toxin-antitoxin system VapC family toxin [Oribacterium sp.]|jgi:tRNA(fMet)-specific endonuclease VapC|nr:type II toxin-antitoxin system VapC family toxin [Oribacterium sp.]MDY6307359.1 type II toxin-antitoxin system VapC family toxin [Oribacterium sp.]MDY6317181.1 type II toxin-antitoxin system VapC family toxin [Oribacterium sp.]
MKYMLDTNIVIYVIKHKPESVLQKFQSLEPSDFCISSITLAEIEYGISKSSRPDRNRFAFDMFISGIDILSFDDAAASEYGPIRAGLERKGTPIGPNDMLIAAHAKSLGFTIVTNNVREFERVEGLKVENWV